MRIYLVLLTSMVLGWLLICAHSIELLVRYTDILILLGITLLYIASHGFRMLRLALLTLDERDKAFELITAHALTAFPSSFLPFKIGELLRLSAFFHVFGHRRKAFAIWLAERFGDVLVITALILSLYLFNVSMPNSMRAIFIIFTLVSVFGLLGLFAVANVLVYLNRHLVLTSHSARGLMLLRASYVLRRLELEIYKSVEGRLIGFLLLSMLIWALEIAALSAFINHYSIGELDFASMFTSGLLASLPGGVVGEARAFGLYQSLALALLTVLFLAALWLANNLKLVRY
ncbi:lysylphosphatidylglycerol synthase domain-containing protein [Limnohabitans sp. T6-20]|uniref:lysylphosphatidylglycerol synthase domain-containing protein n=1 Tax=Limnohabitans sp. T6-20 TaxID=1100725 RepID=UPI001304C102|nr:lysylphosphatidylglycerol synthase domain-containing protein [Limnohabitans sp. T6-20]